MSFEDEMALALDNFVIEAREIIQDMEDSLLSLEADSDPELINKIFRDAHTIKGSSGLFGLTHIVEFTHTVETVLDLLREGKIEVSTELVGVLLPCRDHIAAQIEGVAKGSLTETKRSTTAGNKLLAKLQPYIDGLADGHPAPAAEEPAGAPPAADEDDRTGAAELTDGVVAGGANLHLSLRFGVDSFRNGMDPLAFIGYLSTLGTVTDLVTLTAGLPEAEATDPESCYLAFEAALRTEASVESVEGVFDFVRDDGDIRVLPYAAGPEAFAELVESYSESEDAGTVAAFLVRTGATSASALAGKIAADIPEPELVVDDTAAEPGTAPVEVAVRTKPAKTEPPKSDLPKNDPPKSAPAKSDPAAAVPRQQSRGGESIRVDAPRLDRLIDVVGELVIAGSAAGLRASQSGNDALLEATGEVMRLVEEVRDSALQLRMVPIGTTFSRFQRVVRDMSSELGKDIGLVITGGDTEVDKALVERIGDPLMHLVRNSIDHGIEAAELRAERGKPARGTLRLNAFHDSGSIVIEVQDDGGGIDRDKVLAKAIERGLVEPGANLSDGEIFGLIFEPGFSTAAAISNISGRGVGMDVVKKNVASLRGTIDVESRMGEGSTMRIRLPLTLAIIDGFLVGVGGSSFVVPLDRVVECVELPPGQRNRDYLDLRGEVLPFIRLRSQFSIDGEHPRRENVVVVDYAGIKTGLVVDQLMGEFQTVIKPLGRLFEHVQGVSGSTILGNGGVALIIDVPMLVRHYGDRQQSTERSQPALAKV